MDLETRAQFDPVRRLPSEHERFQNLLQGKPESAWSAPTNCAGWNVGQLTAHLIINAVFLAESVRTGLTNPPPADSREAPLPFGFADLDAFEDWRTAEMKRLLDSGPPGLLAEFAESASGLQEEIGRVDHANAAIPFWHPSGEGRLGYIPTFRLFETQLHEWDIRMTEDPAAQLSEKTIPLMTDRLPVMLGRYCRLRTTADHPGARARIVLTDPARNFLLDWRGGESRALVDDGGPADVTLTGRSGAFLLLVAGRADRDQCERDGSFRILGDASVGGALAGVLFQPLKYL